MERKPKILIFAHEQYLNGASLSLLSILKALKYKYHFLVILPGDGPMVYELEKLRIDYQLKSLPRCAYFNWVSVSDHLKRVILYYKNKYRWKESLLLLSSKFEPDIVYTNTSVVSLGYDLANKINKPHLWHIREYGKKDFKLEYLPSKKEIINKIKKSHISIFTTNLLKVEWLGENKFNSKVIYNGVSLKNKSKIRNRNEFVIGVVGNIMESKNQELALKIFRKCFKYNENLRLNLYGKHVESYYTKLVKFIEENGLIEVVSFMGYVPNSNIYNNIDLLMSCADSEGFGRTLIEAMSNKVPVLSRKSGGPVEILNEISEYSLFGTLEEAVVLINKLVYDKNFYSKSSEAGFNLVNIKYSLKSYINSMDLVFESTYLDV